MTRDEWRPDLEAVFEHYGGRILSSSGQWAKATCPLDSHDDRNPSASVNLDAGKWSCFSCGGRGDALDIIQANEGLDFKEALSWAKNNFEGDGVDRRSASKRRPGRRNWTPPWAI